MTELENLTYIDIVRKKQVGIEELEQILEHLPSLGRVEKQADTTENPQEGTKMEVNPYDKATI